MTNLLKMLQFKEFYQESFVDFCENIEIREIGKSDNTEKDDETQSQDRICLILLESEDLQQESKVFE